MKANELRVGNFVIGTDGKIGSIDEIVRHHSCERNYAHVGRLKTIDKTIFHFGNGYLEDLNPIPLTEEWLVKFGFEMHENAPWVLQKQPLMCNIGNRFTWHYKTLSIKDIKYVHQLQNLYFALTGEELQLK